MTSLFIPPTKMNLTGKFEECVRRRDFNDLFCNTYSTGKRSDEQLQLRDCLVSILGSECRLFNLLTGVGVSTGSKLISQYLTFFLFPTVLFE